MIGERDSKGEMRKGTKGELGMAMMQWLLGRVTDLVSREGDLLGVVIDVQTLEFPGGARFSSR